ncbi:MAG: DUF3307 domain-containing protein [Patescibacteria group bacterium]
MVIATSALFVLAYLGHMVGDFLLQSTWMALTKSQKGLLGMWACTVHVTLYTSAVVLMLWLGGGTIATMVVVAIFIPHWVIDRWSLGEKWLRMTRSRNRNRIEKTSGLMREYAFAFYAPVYISVDNTLHFLCLWATIRYLMV